MLVFYHGTHEYMLKKVQHSLRESQGQEDWMVAGVQHFYSSFLHGVDTLYPVPKKKKKGHNNEAQSAHKEIDSNLDSTCLNPASSSFLFSTVTSLCDYWSFYLHSPITDMGMFLNLRFITLISVSDDGRLGKRKSTQCCRRWALEVRLDGRYHFSSVGLSFLIWQGFFMFCAFVNNLIMELIYLRQCLKLIKE